MRRRRASRVGKENPQSRIMRKRQKGTKSILKGEDLGRREMKENEQRGRKGKTAKKIIETGRTNKSAKRR